ncbi:MAG: hypothetical protein EXR62_04940 [Chloroflexi bacterium]|nr:hypothetical protein [Chloroflexota bacterium]
MATRLSMDVKQVKLQAYRESRRRGMAWLLQQMNSDGSIGDPQEGFYFYRAPWTFAVTGETEAAHAICGWIRQHMLTPEGTIDGPYRTSGYAYTYQNSALIIGAHLALQYDLSCGVMANLLTYRDPRSGGFANDKLDDGGMSDDMDIPFTCGAGFACLATGHIDEARDVYRFLKNIYQVQEALPERFYYTLSRQTQAPIKEYPKEREIGYLVENQAARRQRWTIGGISAGFLCRLYMVDPRPEYMALARKYQAFSMAATERQFDYSHVCKSSWGSSLLYQLTGEEQYLSWTHKMGDWYIDNQNAAGYWHWDYYTTLGSHIELALEFVMHLDTLIGGLASRP